MRYKDETLEKLQKQELFLLKELIRVCEKYKIDYFMVHGSALGCVRHQGFIPWDDDIDVGMMVEDYYKLLSVPKKEWNEKIVLCDPLDDNEKHYFPYPRLYLKDTLMIPEVFRMLQERKRNNSGTSICGIWLDIFLYHRVLSEEEAVKIDKKVYSLRKKYLYAKQKKMFTDSIRIKEMIVTIIENVYHIVANIWSHPEKRIVKKYNSLFANRGNYVTTYDPRPSGPQKNICKFDDMFPVIKMTFENIEVNMLKNYDAVLRKIYGNYMELPPIEDRWNHAPIVLDFGDGKGNQIQ